MSWQFLDEKYFSGAYLHICIFAVFPRSIFAYLKISDEKYFSGAYLTTQYWTESCLINTLPFLYKNCFSEVYLILFLFSSSSFLPSENKCAMQTHEKYRYRGAIFSFKVFSGITMVWIHYDIIQALCMMITIVWVLFWYDSMIMTCHDLWLFVEHLVYFKYSLFISNFLS